jgi:hypothetical protein
MLETDVRGTAVEAAWIIQGFKIEEKQYVIAPPGGPFYCIITDNT